MGNFVNAIVSMVILGGCVYGFYSLGEREVPERQRPPRPEGILVQTVRIKPHQGPVILEANGVVVPFREIRLAAEVRGRVIDHSPNLRPGRTVRRGETLIKLDPAEYKLEVRRLRQQQEQVKAELAALDVQVGNTKELVSLSEQDLQLHQAELHRMESLAQKAASSQSNVDAARRAALTSRNALVRLQNQTRDLESQRILLNIRQELTQVELERAELDERRTVVTASISGVVVQSSVEVESYLLPGDQFAVIEDTSAMEVSCNLTLDDIKPAVKPADTQQFNLVGLTRQLICVHLSPIRINASRERSDGGLCAK